MYADLKGKAVLVTGASSGIGAETARRFAAEGARVAIHYRTNAAAARAVRDEIEASGGDAVVVAADVASKADIVAMVASVAERFGTIDVLVNNAGSPIVRSTIEDLPEEAWDRAIDVNLKGVFLCSQAVIPAMRQRAGGRIVNVSSLVGRTGESSPHYAVAKGAVNTLTKALARELAPYGILVNAVAPGLVDTPLHGKFTADVQAIFDRVVPKVPLGRAGTPGDVASWIVFLASEQAAYVTGQVIEVDGGQVMV
ncbi:MAG: SDR family NAD(P)-dependent oxidoreductase [Candidatus Binatia bacterium]